MRTHGIHPWRLLVGALVVAGTVWVSAGPLSPPLGPVSPTMKPLDQVEPRTVIRAADLPLTISQPGSYYLVGHITAIGGGITINADNVTIDFMGFTLTGGTGSGVAVTGLHTNITLRNGTVRGWDDRGINAGTGRHVRVMNMNVSNNDTEGLAVGDGSIVRDSIVHNNMGDGICALDDTMIINCVVTENQGNGIFTGSGCTVTDCVVSNNTGDGILLIDNCRIVNNTCDGNGETNGAGIHTTALRSRIEGNHVTGSARGFDIDGTDNLIIRNTAAGNDTNYSIAVNNPHGPLVAVSGAADISGVAGSTHPWANFDY